MKVCLVPKSYSSFSKMALFWFLINIEKRRRATKKSLKITIIIIFLKISMFETYKKKEKGREKK